MITIIHGDDVVSSRKYLSEQKHNSKDPYSFEVESLSITDLVQVVEGGSLFSVDKYIFIENLLSSKKSQEEPIQYIINHNGEAEFFLWEPKELTAKTISQFPKAKVHVFKFPQKLFSFLDSLIPKNSSIPLFHELLTTTESELIFFMIIRQFRILLSLKEPANETIDEVKRMAPWQKSRLQKQASLFSKKKLVSLYNSLYEIELSQKTGFSAMSITDSIDFFLADL